MGRPGEGDGVAGIGVADSSMVGVDVVVGSDVGCDWVTRGSRDNVAETAGDDSETEEVGDSTSREGVPSGAEVGVQARTVTIIIVVASRASHLRIDDRRATILT